MRQDERDYLGLTEIEFSNMQRRDLRIGFTFLGAVILSIIAVTVWFFS